MRNTMPSAPPAGFTSYGSGPEFFRQVHAFFLSTQESELTRWKYEYTTLDRMMILRRAENYEFILTRFCDSTSVHDIPNASGVKGGCGVCRTYHDGCPQERADVGFANGQMVPPGPHVMLGSGLNCMVQPKCVKRGGFLARLEALFANRSKLVSKADLFMPDACNMPFVERDAQGRVLLYMAYRFGLYIDFLLARGALAANRTSTVLEIGAGWGGFAGLVKQMLPQTRYIILDIPTSLPLQMSYAHHLGYRCLTLADASGEAAEQRQHVKALLRRGDFDFLFILPHQIELLPDRSVSLAVNLDSMVEMPAAALSHYMLHIKRLSNAFYANNRMGHHNGWPSFRKLVTWMLNNDTQWRLEYDEQATRMATSVRESTYKMVDHVMMVGKHREMFLRRVAE